MSSDIAGVFRVHLAYHTIGWPTLEEALPAIAAAGYEGFEAFSTIVATEDSAFRDLCQRYGLKVAALYHGAELLDEARIPDEVRDVYRLAGWLRRHGADRLVLGGGRLRPGGTTLDDYRRMAKALSEMGRLCQEEGVLVCYHPHWGSAVQDRQQLDLLMDLSDPRYLFLAPDTAHLAVGGCDPVEVFQQYASRIRYVHLKDVAADGVSQAAPREGARETPYHHFRSLGQGVLDIPAILEVLRRTRYMGWLTVELDWSTSPSLEARRSREHLRGLLGALPGGA